MNREQENDLGVAFFIIIVLLMIITCNTCDGLKASELDMKIDTVWKWTVDTTYKKSPRP